MGKFKIITDNGRVSVRQKLSSGENINSNETAFFSRAFVKGLMRPTVEEAKKLMYIGAVGIPLSKFIRRRVNKGQFFMIVGQVIEVVKKTSANNLRLANLVLDAENIFINDRTGDLFFIYQPVTGAQPNVGLIPFLRQLVSACSFDSNEDVSYVNNFVGYLNSLRSFSMPEFEKYIYGTSPQTYGILTKMGYITQNMQQPMPQTAPRPMQQPVQQPIQQQTAAQARPAAPVQAQPQTSVFARPNAAAPAPAPTPVPKPLAPIKPAAPAPTAENPVAEKIISDINAGSAKLHKDDAPVPVSISTPVSAPAPSLLNDSDEGTMLLSDLDKQAKLTRRSNGDVLVIDSDSFRIGKDKSRTDYCVTDNKTVSRLHATIIRRNGEFFIMDNGSTNRTFINGTPIPAQARTPIHSGDIIKLSNEEFDFTV